jgi:hypothetical protein
MVINNSRKAKIQEYVPFPYKNNGGIMKNTFIVLLVMLITVNFSVTADEEEYEGLGLFLGLETGVVNINKADKEDREPYVMPFIIYEKALLDGALDIFAELDYTFGYIKTPSEDKREVFPQSLYFDLLLAYNLGLGNASTLSFLLENEFDEFIIAPSVKKDNNITGIFTPAVNFNQGFDFGDLYARVGSPITYIQNEKNADTLVGLDLTLGFYSAFGLGLEAKALTLLVPGEGRGYLGLEALITFETGPVYFEVLAEIPKDISEEGVIITPEFDFSFGNFTVYTFCEFTGIGAGGSIGISPAIGIKYSF